jgi:hypothetical protein
VGKSSRKAGLKKNRKRGENNKKRGEKFMKRERRKKNQVE